MKLKELEARLTALEDIEEINKLQKAYGFYLTHWMGQEIVDLFADSPDVSLVLLPGKFLGKKSIARYFLQRKPNPELLFAIMQLSGIVDVAPDGKTAKGRWFGYGPEAVPCKKGVYAHYLLGIYENEYVKEDGTWKIKKLDFKTIFTCPVGECWVKPDRLVPQPATYEDLLEEPDIPHTTKEEKYPLRYPSGYIFPFHYKHPVTGK